MSDDDLISQMERGATVTFRTLRLLRVANDWPPETFWDLGEELGLNGDPAGGALDR